MGFTKRSEWSKSYRIHGRDHFINYDPPRKKIPPFGDNESPLTIAGLLEWEYGRKWLKDRDLFIQKRNIMDKPKKIRNDYTWWLEKTRPKPLVTSM